MFQRKEYKNPPLIEALFEIYFSETISNLTLFGDFYNQIKSEYKNQKELKNVGFEMNFSPEMVHTKQFDKGSMMRFSKEDNSQLVQITKNLLTFNKLKPYNGFESFKEEFQEIFDKYVDLAKPQNTERIGLRYINKITIPEETFSLDDYFNFSLRFSDDSFSTIAGISFKVQLIPKNLSHQLFVTLNSAKSPEEGESEFLLDIYDTFISHREVDKQFILNVLDEAHENIENVFEGVITDKSRNLFEVVK